MDVVLRNVDIRAENFRCPCWEEKAPNGPKIEKNQDRPPGLKFSSEIEDFKRATHQTPKFFGGEFRRSGFEVFKRD